jgi:hypothetical protein
VIREQVSVAVAAALESQSLDLEIRSIQETQTLAAAQAALIEGHLAVLKDWEAQIRTVPAGQPLDEATRLWLWEASSLADRESGGALLLEAYPPPGAPVEAYLTWLDQAIKALERGKQALAAQIAALETEKNDLVSGYGAAAQQSLGLSANLVVDKISADPPQVALARPLGAFVFIGGMLGLIAWGLLWLARIALRRKQSGRSAGNS